MRKIVVLLSCVIWLISVTATAQQYLINVHLTGLADGTRFMLMDMSTSKNIDSAVSLHERFTMQGHLSQPAADLVLYSGNRYQRISLLIGNDTVQVKADIKDLPYNVIITGSAIQDVQNELNKKLNANNKKIDALRNEVLSAKDPGKEKMLRDLDDVSTLETRNEELKMEFAMKHPNSYAGLKTLLPFNKRNADTLQYIYDRLNPELKAWVYGHWLANYLKSTKYLKIGNYITDFTMTDMAGTAKRLFDYKGRYLLLYFYKSANCMLCDNDLYDLKNINDHYGDKITIIGISTDSSKSQWQNTRNAEPWFKYWVGDSNTQVTDKYGPYLSPAYFIVDTQGKILYTHLGYMKTSGMQGPLEMVLDTLLKGR